ncbi:MULTISPECIES: hypothetical protein [unclassified Variovorax]|jgi:hypothetical protein|uniref:hypothetical protein n=1 Tax=unclassified Variovorax TaxID=663243 RepID=UPI000F7F9D75|nr:MULTISPECIES: hypothetical protein [unclassified Variovorax]RSZ35102.1 hypothetical protein EJO70_24835 [Variovorax sp. 553]RSZ35880.1 hypothetical protein EJO71_25655 [Variovorax sp. 679]
MSTVASNTRRPHLTSPTQRAILQYLQMHGECTQEQLAAGVHRFSTWRITADSVPGAHRNWLPDHLGQLRAQGYVCKRTNQAGEVVWFVGTEPVESVAQVPEFQPPTTVAAPRHIDVMFGAVYRPAMSAPARAGAAAHTQIPSLIGGRRVAYRAPMPEQFHAVPSRQEESPQ